MSDLKVGESLPKLVKTITLVQLVAYAGATWDFYRLHYDGEFARSRGMPGPIADGQMLGAYLAQMVTNWAGPNAFIRRLDFRLRSPIGPGDTLTCWGRVTSVNPGDRLITLAMGIHDDHDRDVVSHASAVVDLGDHLPGGDGYA